MICVRCLTSNDGQAADTQGAPESKPAAPETVPARANAHSVGDEITVLCHEYFFGFAYYILDG